MNEENPPEPNSAQEGSPQESTPEELSSLLLRNLIHVFGALIAAMVALTAALLGWRVASVHGAGARVWVLAVSILAGLCALPPLVLIGRFSSRRVRLGTSLVICLVSAVVAIGLAIGAAQIG